MKAGETNRPAAPTPDTGADDSPVVLLRRLEQERGRLFTEADYQELRQAVLDELAHGARLRPFTFFTFGVVAAGLAVLMGIGVATSRGGKFSDYTLAWMSGLALASWSGFLWALCRGVKRDRLRTLEERLQELGELRRLDLVTAEEYQHLQSHILHQRQRSSRL